MTSSSRRSTIPSESTAIRPPLGLPEGSVRALLTIIISGIVAEQTARGETPGLLWGETLMIALAHYFTSRRLVELPAGLLAQLEAEGRVERDAPPLFFPKHSIRFLILLIFAAAAWRLYDKQQLWTPAAMQTLGVVAAYVLGMLFRGSLRVLGRTADRRLLAVIGDLKALAALLAVGAAALAYFLDRPDLLSPRMEHIALGVILFYFGSR